MAELNYMQRARLNGYRAVVTTASGERIRCSSLIDDARVSRIKQQQQRRSSITQQRSRLKSESVDQPEPIVEAQALVDQLDDEAIEVTYSEGDAAQQQAIEYALVVVCSSRGAAAISHLLQLLNECQVSLLHLETRSQASETMELLVQCRSSRPDYLKLLARAAGSALLRQAVGIEKVDRLNSKYHAMWFPEHISELDSCVAVVTKYEPTSDPRHPGFGDNDYIERRQAISERALAYRYGEPLPDTEYTAAEQAVWQQVYNKLKLCHEQFACAEYKANLKMLEDAGLYTPDAIPQLQPVSDFMRSRSGFQMRPCGGLLSPRHFLASLAHRVFQATQYVRHPSKPHHSPEPDVIHELIGHVPMLCDPLFAQFSQEVGMASLGASDEHIEKLSTVYWFMVEFGLCWEEGQLKACGAGLLSSYGELLHAVSNKVEHRAFQPAETAVQAYSDDDYQSVYYVADSIQSAMHKLRLFAGSAPRPFQVYYCPFTQRILKVHSSRDCKPLLQRIHNDMASLSLIHAALETNKQL